MIKKILRIQNAILYLIWDYVNDAYIMALIIHSNKLQNTFILHNKRGISEREREESYAPSGIFPIESCVNTHLSKPGDPEVTKLFSPKRKEKSCKDWREREKRYEVGEELVWSSSEKCLARFYFRPQKVKERKSVKKRPWTCVPQNWLVINNAEKLTDIGC